MNGSEAVSTSTNTANLAYEEQTDSSTVPNSELVENLLS